MADHCYAEYYYAECHYAECNSACKMLMKYVPGATNSEPK
jgi:hypothetical protein